VENRQLFPSEIVPGVDFRNLFESTPGLYLVLLPNASFTIVAASNAYLTATMTKREEVVGRGIFDIFPDNPSDPAATGVQNLRESLERVVQTQMADAMAIQKYDIRRPDTEGGGFEKRYWSSINLPVLNEAGNFVAIIHRVEDVTQFVHLKQIELEQNKVTEELKTQAASMEAEILHRSRELEVANRQLRETNRQLQASSQSAEQGRKEALNSLRSIEDQLFLSQKLEAVGRLAGGVAHDFNNLLTAIIGYSELTLKKLEPNDPLRRNLTEIKAAGDRAAALTRQLLAFSRKQVMQPKVLDLNQVVSNLQKMLLRLIGEEYELRMNLGAELGNVKADPGQIEQVIMNLVLNARDAMPAGGKVSIETSNIHLDESYAREHVSVVAGAYVMLAVSDSGTGIDENTRQHIFEPFFTTKEAGKGTGLGLSTVYGIVKQSGGNIWVYSEVGKGTTFKIYFPRITEQAEEYKPPAAVVDVPKGSETILLVEDAGLVRTLAREVLQTSGYRVFQAASAEEALLSCEKNKEPIDLLLTDVVMPGANGRQLAERLLKMYPQMRVLFMSGYTEDTIMHHGVLDDGINFIQKPFGPSALAVKVREVLDKG
jgi:signal transduction histidine kinase